MRTLSNWQRKDPEREGRPPTEDAMRFRALRLVAREHRRQGRGTGWRPIVAELGGRVPTRLVQSSLRDWKQHRARRAARQRLQHRTSVRVHARDAIWSLDSTHLGRVDGASVEGQVIRDPATRATPVVSAGAAVTGSDVIQLLECMRMVRGTLPLVLCTDNGAPYRCRLLQRYLQEHDVVPLLNVPRTPQHNAFVECAIGELKKESALGKGVRLRDEVQAARRLTRSAHRLDTARRRACLGYRTALEADAVMPRADALVKRGRFFEEAHCARERAVLGCRNGRDRRRAERNSVYTTLETNGLITRTRGGVPLAPVKPEVVL